MFYCWLMLLIWPSNSHWSPNALMWCRICLSVQRMYDLTITLARGERGGGRRVTGYLMNRICSEQICVYVYVWQLPSPFVLSTSGSLSCLGCRELVLVPTQHTLVEHWNFFSKSSMFLLIFKYVDMWMGCFWDKDYVVSWKGILRLK